MMDFDAGVRIIAFISQNPLFKGISLIVLAVLAALFGLWFNKGNNVSKGFWGYMLVVLVIFIYGIYILIVRPQWWLPPYMIK